MHRIRRPDNIFRAERGQRLLVGKLQIWMVQRDLAPARAAFPHAHQPDRVGMPGHQFVENLGRNTAERHGAAKPFAQIGQPDPGVDFVNERVSAHE